MHLATRICLGLLSLAITSAAWAQAVPPPADNSDPLGPPTERGIRFTPAMARAMAQLFTKNVLVPHFELDPAKSDETINLITRRVMSTAHSLDPNGAVVGEFFITKMSEALADHPEGMENPFNPEFQKGLAQQLLPALPAVRDLIGGVGRDVMPMLSFKQQLKMTAELAAAGTALNGFETTMQRWARGEAQPGEDPFSDQQAQDAAKKDNSGQSVALKVARNAAQKEIDKQEWLRSMWENYLKDFKKFYALDASQSATGDSVLREYLERAAVLTKDATWRDQIYRSRLWLNMAARMRLASSFSSILSSRYEEAMAPLNRLGDEFRLRLEEIPTAAQKKAAEDRIMTALKERGYDKSEVN